MIPWFQCCLFFPLVFSSTKTHSRNPCADDSFASPPFSLLGTSDKSLKHSTGTMHNPSNNPSGHIQQGETAADCYNRFGGKKKPSLGSKFKLKSKTVEALNEVNEERQEFRTESTGSQIILRSCFRCCLCNHTESMSLSNHKPRGKKKKIFLKQTAHSEPQFSQRQ